MDVGGYSSVGGRETNEDAWCVRVDDDGVVLAIADGMGGHAAGEIASRVAIRVAGAPLPHESPTAQILRAHDAVRTVAHESPETRGMGTTGTFVRVETTGARARVAHVGDSRVALWRPSRTFEPPVPLHILVSAHTIPGRLLATGAISPADYALRPDKNRLLQNLGMPGRPEVETIEVDLRVGDVLILTTDGVHEVVDDARLAALCRGAVRRGADAIARRVVAEAVAAGTSDNATCVVARILP